MPNLKLGHTDTNLYFFLISFSAEFVAGSTILSHCSQKFSVLIYQR